MSIQNNFKTYVILLPQNIKVYKKGFFLLFGNKNYDYLIKIYLGPVKHLAKKNSFLTISGVENEGILGAWHKMARNLIYGLARAHSVRLFLKGIGFRASLIKKKEIEFKLGFSHSIKKEIKNYLNINIYKNSIINLSSPLKDLLGVESSQIYFLRKPDAYKGKGILFNKKPLLLKAGKKT